MRKLEEENRKLQADAKATVAEKQALKRRQAELEAQKTQAIAAYEAELSVLKKQNNLINRDLEESK